MAVTSANCPTCRTGRTTAHRRPLVGLAEAARAPGRQGPPHTPAGLLRRAPLTNVVNAADGFPLCGGRRRSENRAPKASLDELLAKIKGNWRSLSRSSGRLLNWRFRASRRGKNETAYPLAQAGLEPSGRWTAPEPWRPLAKRANRDPARAALADAAARFRSGGPFRVRAPAPSAMGGPGASRLAALGSCAYMPSFNPRDLIAARAALVCSRCGFRISGAAVTSKGRLMRCTVLGSTPNRAAIFRTPSVRPGAFRAARISHALRPPAGGQDG